MLFLREFRQNPDRLTDVLPWAAYIAPGVILNKDGSFQSTIKYRGPDLDSATVEELTVSTAHLNNILRRLGSGWALWIESQRSPTTYYPSAQFPDPISYLIDEERRRRFARSQHFESHYYVTLQYLPPADRTQNVVAKFVTGHDGKSSSYERLLEGYINDVSRIVTLLERIYPEARVLSEEETLTFLHALISDKDHAVHLPEIPMYLDALLADTPLVGGFKPQIGKYALSIVSILGFPGTSQPGLLDSLNRLAIPYRWVTRWIALDKHDARGELEDFKRKWFAKRKGGFALVRELLTKEESALSDPDALQKTADVDSALLELGTDDVSYGYLTTSIVLRDEDEETLRANTTEIERIINGHGFVTKHETINAVDAWLGAIPGNARNNVRRPILNTLNLAHLMPGASAVWAGPKENEHLKAPPLIFAETSGSTPFRLVTHVGDVGHTLILGPTGSGKSTLLNLIEAQFLRYEDSQVYVFDKGGSARALTLGLGGDYFDLGAEDAPLAFQPLARIDQPAELNWAHEWLLDLAAKENVTITPDIKKIVWETLHAVARQPVSQRTVFSFLVLVQNEQLKKALHGYTIKGAHGKLLDSATESLELSRFQCFEMERLMETPTVVLPVLSYLFHRLERRFTGAPTLIVLDEAWIFLDHPIFAAKIREWLKTLRKLNVSVIFATQSLADIDGSSIAPTLREACFTKIYLPNPSALQPDAAEFYHRFGLNNRQVDILATAYPKQDYYYTSPRGNRLFQLGLEPFSLAYCAGVSPERHRLLSELESQSISTQDFNIRYLEKLGLHDEAQVIKEITQEKEAA